MNWPALLYKGPRISSCLTNLTTDILVDIFSYLTVDDVLGIRPVRNAFFQNFLEQWLIDASQTCKHLEHATQDKLLWVYLLRALILEKHAPLPPYLKPTASLTAKEVEALTRRIHGFAMDWEYDTVTSRSTLSFFSPRSVSWLKILSGRWVFVAASDTLSSSLACWDIGTAFSGETKPLAECYLTGPVHDAEVEVQTDGIVIAASVASRCV